MSGQQAEPPAIGVEDLMWVFCTNSVRTSAGSALGAKQLPRSEAAALIASKMAVAGDKPPAGFAGATDTTTAGIAVPPRTPHTTRGNVTP